MNSLITKAIERIPLQLRREELRFVPIWSGTKKPFEPKWNVEGGNNYRFDDPKLAAFLIEGHNYGLCTGIGDLIVFDSDNELRLKELGIVDDLPETFTVRTGAGGLHRYFECQDHGDKIILFDLELEEDSRPVHLGEIQTKGFQCVGPGSLHPNGNRYTVVNDLPIAQIEWTTFSTILEGKVEFSLADYNNGINNYNKENNKPKLIRVKRPGERDPFELVNVEDILYPAGKIRKSVNGRVVKGSHPVHGSNGGQNFQIDTSKNVWYCFRHWVGGGPSLAIAVKEKLIRCDEAGKGVLRGQLYLDLLKVARDRGYIDRPKQHLVERVQ